MSKKERQDRVKKADALAHRRGMAKGVEDFYESVPEDRANPNHLEDFEELLGLFVDDRSVKPQKKPFYLTVENLVMIGFVKNGRHSLGGTIYKRGTLEIVPDRIMDARKADWGEYQIEDYQLSLHEVETEIRKRLHKRNR